MKSKPSDSGQIGSGPVTVRFFQLVAGDEDAEVEFLDGKTKKESMQAPAHTERSVFLDRGKFDALHYVLSGEGASVWVWYE